MSNSIMDMGGKCFIATESFKERVRANWADDDALIEIIAREMIEQTTYEGMAGEHCSRLDRREFGRDVAQIGFLLGRARTPEEFFEKVNELKGRTSIIQRSGNYARIRRRTIQTLGLPVRAFNALFHEGIRAIDDLVKMSPGEVLAIRNIGRGSYILIKKKLEELDVLPESWRSVDGRGY